LTIVLFRVDERLIHGQVVIGCGHQLRPDRYVVVDDGLAESDWEQELYSLGAGGAEVAFLSSDEAPSVLDSMEADDSRTIVLTRDVATMRRLAEHGSMGGRTVNFGGLHHGPGRRKVLTYVHLSPSEIEDLRAMARAGVRLQARELPDAPRVDLAEELELA
jgi:PTS system mannose-specific IIB component/fructoselysine and glucoselysine-specific PTS system IIB component